MIAEYYGYQGGILVQRQKSKTSLLIQGDFRLLKKSLFPGKKLLGI